MLAVGLISAIVVLLAQLPMYKLQEQLASLGSILPSQSSYGRDLGIIVDRVVKNIHARIPNAEITHADILTIMCMESAGLVGRRQNIRSSAGARGLTQVMPDTLRYYSRSNVGGFYLPNRPDLLYSDSRFSIEAGALIFNHHLMNYVPRNGNIRGRTIAAIAYNGGPGRVGLPSNRLPRETYNYAYQKLPNCFNKIIRGQSPVNTTIWEAMVAKVVELTGGRLAADVRGALSDIESIRTAPREVDRVSSLGRSWWQSAQGRQVSQQSEQRAAFAPRGSDSWIDKLFNNYNSAKDNTTEAKKPDSNAIKKNIPKAKIFCERRSVDTVYIKWSCPKGTTISSGLGTGGVKFDTGGAGAGAVNSDYVSGAEYTVKCFKGHQLYAKSKCSSSKK